MGVSEKEDGKETVAITIMTVPPYKKYRFTNIGVICGHCGEKILLQDTILFSTNRTMEHEHRVYRKFVTLNNDVICPHCKHKEVWITSKDAPFAFSPGCGYIFDSSLFNTPNES